MLRKGRWKYIEYIGFEPELFDLEEDPEEATNLAVQQPAELARLARLLRQHVDPAAADTAAFAAQDALVAQHGGREKALALGARGATPPPNLH